MQPSPLQIPPGSKLRKSCNNCHIAHRKCDGGIPCKRCQEMGLICFKGVAKRRQSSVSKKDVSSVPDPSKKDKILLETKKTVVRGIHEASRLVNNPFPLIQSTPSPVNTTTSQIVPMTLFESLEQIRKSFAEIDRRLTEHLNNQNQSQSSRDTRQ